MMSAAAPRIPDRATAPLWAHSLGCGSNVILVHGGRGSHTHWIRNIRPLSERYRVHALDLPGFGNAPDVSGDISAEAYLSLVHEGVLGLIKNEPAAVLGFSFGGAVAADLSRRLGTQCSRLALIGPGGFGEAKGRSLDLRSAPPTNKADPAYRAVIRHNLLAMMLSDPSAVDEATIDLQCENIARARFNSLKVSLRPTLLADLAAQTCPLLMVWGEKDVVAHPSPASRAQACLTVRPDARVSMIPAAGHWVQYEASESFNGLVLGFLGEQN